MARSAVLSQGRMWLGLIALILVALAFAVLPTLVSVVSVSGLLLILTLLRFPDLAIYLLVLAVPFGSWFPLSFAGASLTAADALLALAWALYLARGVSQRRIGLRVPPLALPFTIFILAAGVSITGALSLTDAVIELVKWIELFAAYWLVWQVFSSKKPNFLNTQDNSRALQRLLAVMFLAGLAEAAIGAYQYYFRAGPEGFLLFGGANLRAYGTFEQPNPYAGYLGLIIPLAFGTALGMLGEVRRRVRSAVECIARDLDTSPYQRMALLALSLVALGAMLAALFFSYSRGAWVGIGAALGITYLIRSRRAMMLGLAAGALLGVVVLLGQFNLIPDVVSERFATVGDYFGFEDVRGVRANDANFAIVERRAHWQAALEMFEDSPWVGIGIGNYADVYPRYALPKWDDPLGHAHNYYLNVLGEAGLLGFTAYAALWLAIFSSAWRTVRHTVGWRQGVAAGAFGVLVALSIQNLFDNLFVHAMYIQVGLVLAMIAALRRTRAEQGLLQDCSP